MHRLTCVAQNYDWGKRGSASAVARFASSGEGTLVDEAKPYAEYWFGTHPSGPSRLALPDGRDVALQDWLVDHPAALGVPAYDATTALPFLFKVLSVAKALSIQAHPDRTLGAKLHAARPDMYKDANHKPELACALTPFMAMCGFRAAAEVAAHLQSVPELRAAVGNEAADAFIAAVASGDATALKSALREAFAALMHADVPCVASQTTALASRLAALPLPASGTHPDAVARTLCAQYPGDIGVFAPYLLNTIELAPGEAVFLAANEPHAYLAGDCVEVMATSDNVVRAGLTPKFKDVDVLVDMLSYSMGAPIIDTGVALDAHTKRYCVPVPEFELQYTILSATDGLYHLPPAQSAAIWIVVEGAGSVAPAAGTPEAVATGQVWLQEAGEKAALSTDSRIVFYRAMAGERAA